jgi:hypothetical protein
MSFLMRGRSSWWLRDQSHAPAPEPVPEPVAQATDLPVVAPAPASGTGDLSLSAQLNQTSVQRLDERHRTETARCNCCNGTPADRQWVTAELGRLERLATLTKKHGPWDAARRMWVPVPRPPSTSSTSVKYRLTLREQR